MQSNEGRIIKFRGMTEAGEWLYGGYVKRNNAHYILDGECDHVEVDGREANILHFHIVKYKTVGEFTGLLDKQGKEIYEGDMVKTTVGKHLWWYLVTTDSNFGGNNLYLITRYRNFRHVNDGEDIEWGDFFVNECRDTLTEYNANNNLEIIGNIYESPHLLDNSS